MVSTLNPETLLVLSPAEQLLLVTTAFIVKPAYMLGAAALLHRFRDTALRELRLVWFALASFLVGEAACGLNYLAFDGESHLVQLLHDLGMAGCFAMLVRAAMHALEETVLRATHPDKACTLLRICRVCVKHSPVRCMLHTGRLWLTAVALVAAAMPLTIGLRPVRYETIVFGWSAVLQHGLADQIVEARAFPLAALLLLAGSLWTQLRWRPGSRSVAADWLLATGLGFAAFSWMRVGVAFPLLDRIVWMEFWEEASELALIVLVGKGMRGWERRLGG